MATVRLFCGLALLLCCTLGVRGSLDTALGDSSSCHQVCEGTYPLHTYPEEEELFACHRGCRLFSICQFAEEGDLNKTKTECESACIEAYPQSNEQYACILGCHSQMPFAEKRQDELSDMVPRIHILFPLTIVKAFWSDMMDSAQSFMTSSWTFYIQADNGHILVVQSQPEIQQMPPLEPEDLSPRGNMLDAVPYLGNGHSVGEGLWSRRASILELDGGEGIMKCFSMNSNWLLTATLLLSILVLLWICCATVATASDQYIPSEKLSIYGDLEYLNEQKLYKYPPASLVVVHGLPQENEDAGPLPTKVDLAKSDI
ncbi:transmembrane protein 59 isoform X2 [Bufo gargarizans]|uniref:transmembrane protein 59 isoform X2 n=1 Tax=Bufo gargarizans TaxID=30331 RepID=UPI001CF3E2AB|nr:transmembrane protein 59 isoform X2 [Bufo gargarizans]